MLQHSRQTTGKKNQQILMLYADEYLRLSYHGLRAKDKNFNADFKTDFDETHWKNKYCSAGYWKSIAESF